MGTRAAHVALAPEADRATLGIGFGLRIEEWSATARRGRRSLSTSVRALQRADLPFADFEVFLIPQHQDVVADFRFRPPIELPA